MEQASLCIYYTLIAVSYVHCLDATVKHEFSEQHMRIVNYQRSLISPIAVYGWNYKMFWSVLVLTGPDQLGVKRFV